jgi:2-polyprenyl-3-methyl-5-hydroxy-6-metoxy-1,4-benzoquinol methylase
MMERVTLADIFRLGQSTAKTEKLKRISNSLGWRHAYQTNEIYPIKLCDDRLINIRQISNGESKGLGTGTAVWPAAHVLSKYLEKRFGANGLRGKRVCDIGSGTGCTGFIAAALGAEVTLTDQEQLLLFMESNKAIVCSENVTISSDRIKVEIYNWGASLDHLNPPFDYVLISDCVLPKLYPIEPLIQVRYPDYFS